MSSDEDDSGDSVPAPSPMEVLQRRLGNDRDAALAVLSAFQRDAPVQLRRLREAAESGSVDQVRLLAHTMKGTLLWIGADPAAATAGALEALPAGVEALSTLTAQVEQLLRELAASGGPG